MIAAENNNPDIVTILLKNRADDNTENAMGRTFKDIINELGRRGKEAAKKAYIEYWQKRYLSEMRTVDALSVFPPGVVPLMAMFTLPPGVEPLIGSQATHLY